MTTIARELRVRVRVIVRGLYRPAGVVHGTRPTGAGSPCSRHGPAHRGEPHQPDASARAIAADSRCVDDRAGDRRPDRRADRRARVEDAEQRRRGWRRRSARRPPPARARRSRRSRCRARPRRPPAPRSRRPRHQIAKLSAITAKQPWKTRRRPPRRRARRARVARRRWRRRSTPPAPAAAHRADPALLGVGGQVHEGDEQRDSISTAATYMRAVARVARSPRGAARRPRRRGAARARTGERAQQRRGRAADPITR